jgi:hypothetical protein
MPTHEPPKTILSALRRDREIHVEQLRGKIDEVGVK